MRIVIEIPDKDIPKHQEAIDISLHFMNGKVCEAGGYGFEVLPKGHGRLIDADKLHMDYCNDNCGERKCIDAMDRCVFIGAVLNAPTIIEADKAESEEQE